MKRSAGFPERGKQIVGRYIATAFNEQCRDTYARHGFTQDGDAWSTAAGLLLKTPYGCW